MKEGHVTAVNITDTQLRARAQCAALYSGEPDA